MDDLLDILGRGFGKLLGFRRREKSESFESGQSIVAAVIAAGVAILAIGMLAFWIIAA